ncbi:MAG: NAD-dependent epimerase/dehydratase family protein [Opitutaceae bacterium]
MSPPATPEHAAASLPCAPDTADLFLSTPRPGVLESLGRAGDGPVVVLGAGGKMGLHLALMLRRAFAALGRENRVIGVSRFSTLRDRDEFERHGVETIACDLTDAVALSALPDAPTVFFMAGVKFGTSGASHLLQQLNVEMPRLVAERYQASRIVAFSTGCVYPFVATESGGATEDTPPYPNGEYAASCIAREEVFAEASRRHGTPVALIRLNYSVESRYGLLLDIAQKVFRNEPVDVTMGHVNVIWQTDAVAHAIRALELASSPAVPVNVTGAETLHVRDLALRFGELLGRSVTITGHEADTAWLNNAGRAHRRFGAPATSLENMMRWIAAWIQHEGKTWNKPTGFERRDGRY